MDENRNGTTAMTTRHSNNQGGLRMMGNSKLGHLGIQKNNRRALSSIDQNIIGAPAVYTYAIRKREILEKEENQVKKNIELSNISNKRKVPTLLSNQQASPEKTNWLENFETEEREEYYEVEEVEMEDVVEEEPVLDIDSCDISNPLAVVEYIEDIYAYYRKIENLGCVSPYYMTFQFDINERMRAILVDWLIEVHYKFELQEETLFLTVNLIDRFLENRQIARKNLQLVGLTSLLLACKYEEVFVHSVEEFVSISDNAYTKQQVLDMEKSMVNALQFKLYIPTAYIFMKRFLKAAKTGKSVEYLAFYIIELSLVEYEALKYSPSLLAAAAIYTAQCSICRSNEWTRTSEWHTCYSRQNLLECSKLMVKFHQKAGTGKLTGVYKKYSMCKFGNASKSEPAEFLLDL